MNGESFSLDDVKPGDTVASVKVKIQDMKGIPIDLQKLFIYRSWHVPFSLEPEDMYELPAGFCLNCLSQYQLKTFIVIQIHKIDGASFDLKVEAHEFIWNVKCLLRKLVDIPQNEQYLILDQTHTELINNTRLSQCNVQTNSILHLIRQSPAVYRWDPEHRIPGEIFKATE